MISNAKGSHVSPGIYTEEKDVTYSVKSLGITSLGLVGETLYGPAFQNVEIENWGDFVDYFGGCSTEKFKATGALKYELPYIAKEYLQESKRLNVVRVLGLSGYKAGPAWIVSTSASNAPIVVLRSKMTYSEVSSSCEASNSDEPKQVVTNIEYAQYTPSNYTSNCTKIDTNGESAGKPSQFGLKVTKSDNTQLIYNVSLDSNDNDYIYNIISSDPSTGETPIYIEAVYENNWNGVSGISSVTVATSSITYTKKTSDSGDFKTISGTTYRAVDVIETSDSGDFKTISGTIYRAKDVSSSFTVTSGNVSSITFSAKDDATVWVSATTGDKTAFIKSGATEWTYNGAVDGESAFTYTNSSGFLASDFEECYRPAMTPYIVSNISASKSGENKTIASMKKLFRFYTISDGDAANFQVKISIQNIDPEKGTFDVVVRDFNDTDINVVALEKYAGCSLVEGDSSFIGYKIGTVDGGYEAKSKYITVEMADGDFTNLVPCGFLGYPMPDYGRGGSASALNMGYETHYKSSIKAKKQYFGMSSSIDSDVLKYKGVDAYQDGAPKTKGFHLDAILSPSLSGVAYVDGVSGEEFTCVDGVQSGSVYSAIPRIINAPYMNTTIYADKNLRKFTMCFYGGFDGWDVNEEQRSTTNEYKATNYKIAENSRYQTFKNEALDGMVSLPTTATTADYYAFLAGYRVFANPQDVDINVFSTPGIDWKNHTLLFEDALDIIVDPEDGRGGDALYVVDSPVHEDLSADDLVSEFEDKYIDTSYACTYYPGLMYFDSSNSKYVTIPATKDVVRNMASTDNNSYPWFAPAGIERGTVNCIKALHKTTLAEEDALYEAGINPIKSFAQDGVKIWGNKTLYTVDSPLNRINVRRLMIRVKKLIKDAALSLIFEQYDDSLEKQFKSIVEPILADVKSNRGIYDYRVITECTAETRDQHILPAKILIKPTPALEYISISFVVYPESIEFDEN
jgi:hypothetical protein